jgi:hypothetical protein
MEGIGTKIKKKLTHMTKKHSKKTLELGKHTIFGRLGGGGVSQIHEKKIVSVGLFSTFRHPLVPSLLVLSFHPTHPLPALHQHHFQHRHYSPLLRLLLHPTVTPPPFRN